MEFLGFLMIRGKVMVGGDSREAFSLSIKKLLQEFIAIFRQTRFAIRKGVPVYGACSVRMTMHSAITLFAPSGLEIYKQFKLKHSCSEH